MAQWSTNPPRRRTRGRAFHARPPPPGQPQLCGRSGRQSQPGIHPIPAMATPFDELQDGVSVAVEQREQIPSNRSHSDLSRDGAGCCCAPSSPSSFSRVSRRPPVLRLTGECLRDVFSLNEGPYSRVSPARSARQTESTTVFSSSPARTR
jgi:hypothetical protein